MNNSEIMDFSIEDWVEISRSHPVTCEQMEVFLDIIDGQETAQCLEKDRERGLEMPHLS